MSIARSNGVRGSAASALWLSGRPPSGDVRCGSGVDSVGGCYGRLQRAVSSHAWH